MNIVIHQPNLFPRLKILQKIQLADVWVVLDDVQYCQREYQNRCYIVPLKADSHWCTIPVHLPNGRNTLINEVVFDKKTAIQKIEQTIRHDFKGDTENIKMKETVLASLYDSPDNFVDFVVNSERALLEYAGRIPQILRSSDLEGCGGKKSERLVSICKKLNADTYICDSGGAHYLDESVFNLNGINVQWQVWEPPVSCNARKIGLHIRNGSALNLLARSESEFIDCISVSLVSRYRRYAEGK